MPDYVVYLRPMPGDVPDALRLRKLLKALGRRHGLRCIDVKELRPGPEPGEAPAPAPRPRPRKRERSGV